MTNYQSFWGLLPQDFAVSRDELLHRLADAGVSARRGIMAAHLEPAYHDHPHVTLPVTERLTARSLILLLFHDLTEEQQDLRSEEHTSELQSLRHLVCRL